MEFKQMIETNKFSLVVSLPSNKLELAQAALDGGAQAVKVHCNVWHRASGHTFGTYAENREFLRQLIKLCGDVPVGLVPGGADAFITGRGAAGAGGYGTEVLQLLQPASSLPYDGEQKADKDGCNRLHLQ